MKRSELRQLIREEITRSIKENDLDDPTTPLGRLNNDDRAVDFLNDLMDKYGKVAVQLWVTSGNYPN
jgi:hypothetical protein